MMKWKVTKSSRSSSVDRSSLDCEISEGTDAAKPLPAIPSPPKAEQIKKDEDTIALLPPSRRKQQQHQNGGLRLSRKDSFAASDCIPINLKEILGISRQRSESHLNSLPVLNGERRRSRSEVRVSSTDRLTVAYHAFQVITPQNKLTERNQLKTDQLPVLNGRCPSPSMKNSRWLRGRQRQREPRKSMLGICGGVTQNASTPNGRIPNAAMDRKNLSLQETVALIHNSPPDKPKKEPTEITDTEKLTNSKDNSNVTSNMNGHIEKELDKENIKNSRKTTNECNKQSKEGCRFRRNKGFAPRPGMGRNQNENDKDLNSVEEEINDKPEEIPGNKEENHTDQHDINSVLTEPVINEVISENTETDCQEKEIVDPEKGSDDETSKHCAKKRRDSSGAVVTRVSETCSDSKSFDDVHEQLMEKKITNSPETEKRETPDSTERNNEKNNKDFNAAEKKSESSMSEEIASVNYLQNGFDGDPVSNRPLSHKGEKSPEDRGKFEFYLHEDIKSSSEDLRVNLDHLRPPKKKKNSKSLRGSECLTKVKDTRKMAVENYVLLANKEVENDTNKISKDTEKKSENIYDSVSNCDTTTYDTVCEECEVEGQETMLDSLAPFERQAEAMDIHPEDTSPKVKLYCPASTPPKKKMASHQRMTVSVVVRKPCIQEEGLQPIANKQPEISSSESFVVKKSFVLTIAKQEKGFRSMCANKESLAQVLETADPVVKKEEQISVTFLCAGNAKETWVNGQTSASPMNDMRLRSFSMPPVNRHHQQQDLLCLESVRSRSKERRNKEKQTIKRKGHRQRKKDTGFHMPKAVIDELSKVLEKRKRCIEDEDDEDDDYYYEEDQDGESE